MYRLEDDIKEIPVRGSSPEIALAPHQIVTLRILAQFHGRQP
jgi:hypothetical protein